MTQGKYEGLAVAESNRIDRDLRRNAMEFAMKNCSLDRPNKAVVADAEAYLKFLRGKK